MVSAGQTVYCGAVYCLLFTVYHRLGWKAALETLETVLKCPLFSNLIAGSLHRGSVGW